MRAWLSPPPRKPSMRSTQCPIRRPFWPWTARFCAPIQFSATLSANGSGPTVRHGEGRPRPSFTMANDASMRPRPMGGASNGSSACCPMALASASRVTSPVTPAPPKTRCVRRRHYLPRSRTNCARHSMAFSAWPVCSISANSNRMRALMSARSANRANTCSI